MSLSTIEAATVPALSIAKIVAYIIAALLLVAGGAYAGYRWEAGRVATLQKQEAQALSQAVILAAKVQKSQDVVDTQAAVKEAQAQAPIQTRTVTITKEVPRYVTVHEDAIVCVPVGLARVLRAASAGTDPSAVQLAPGQSDDACSDVTATEVAGWFTAYAGASQANSEQLNALEAWIVANHKAQESVK